MKLPLNARIYFPQCCAGRCLRKLFVGLAWAAGNKDVEMCHINFCSGAATECRNCNQPPVTGHVKHKLPDFPQLLKELKIILESVRVSSLMGQLTVPCDKSFVICGAVGRVTAQVGLHRLQTGQLGIVTVSSSFTLYIKIKILAIHVG